MIDDQRLVWLTEDDFVNHFAGDVDPVEAKVLYAVQQPLVAGAYDEVMAVPAWKARRSWYLVAQDDEAPPPDVQRMFAARMSATTIEASSGHLAMVSPPDEVTKLIQSAAEAASAARTAAPDDRG